MAETTPSGAQMWALIQAHMDCRGDPNLLPGTSNWAAFLLRRLAAVAVQPAGPSLGASADADRAVGPSDPSPCRSRPSASIPGADDSTVEALRRGLNALQRFSFLIADSGNGIACVPDRSGRWIDWHSAHELFDPVKADALLMKLREQEAGR